MNRERIKSVSLLFLVILSFVLTTRIWFYTSIEGVFIMSGNKSIKPDYNAEYDKSDLLRPHKLIVSFGERSTLLYDNEEYSEAYGRIFKEAKRVMRTAILVNSKEVVKRIPMEELYKIRNSRGITFVYNLPLEMEAVYKLMNINSYPDIGIRGIDEIIVAQGLDRAYLCDSVQGILYEYRTDGIQNNLDYLISNLEKQPTVLSLYLDSIQPEMYGKNSVVPTRISEKRFPVLSGQKEVEGSDEIPESIAGLFDDEITSLSIIKNMDGTIVYTNREGQVVKLYTDGMLEYVNFNLQPDDKTTVSVGGAIDISTEFVSRHFGFPEDCYISDIIKINSMGDDKYIIRYRYAYEGLPVLSASDINSGSIEVEIVGDEVRRYKRIRRILNHSLEYEQAMSSIDVLDILLDKKVEALSGETIKKVNDMYLAYYERFGQNSITYVPVWVAEVTVERLDKGTVLNQKYIINAETGIILDK